MKKFLLVFIGICLTLTVGLFWLAHWVFLPFEHREDFNGVGWSAFASSIRKHLNEGEYTISDFGYYEGWVNFEVTDSQKNFYHISTSRRAYLDARNMQTLKSADLRVIRIGDLSLVCKNNHGEDVWLYVSRKRLGLSGELPRSLNEMLEMSGPVVSSFGKSLPRAYNTSEGKLIDLPDGLSMKTVRNPSCCSQNKGVEEAPTSITCQFD